MQVKNYLLIYIFIFFALLIISCLVSAKPPNFIRIQALILYIYIKIDTIIIYNIAAMHYCDILLLIYLYLLILLVAQI